MSGSQFLAVALLWFYSTMYMIIDKRRNADNILHLYVCELK